MLIVRRFLASSVLITSCSRPTPSTHGNVHTRSQARFHTRMRLQGRLCAHRTICHALMTDDRGREPSILQRPSANALTHTIPTNPLSHAVDPNTAVHARRSARLKLTRHTQHTATFPPGSLLALALSVSVSLRVSVSLSLSLRLYIHLSPAFLFPSALPAANVSLRFRDSAVVSASLSLYVSLHLQLARLGQLSGNVSPAHELSAHIDLCGDASEAGEVEREVEWEGMGSSGVGGWAGVG